MLILDKICPVCHLLNEDDGHCFLKCKMVKAVWQSAQLEEERTQLVSAD